MPPKRNEECGQFRKSEKYRKLNVCDRSALSKHELYLFFFFFFCLFVCVKIASALSLFKRFIFNKVSTRTGHLVNSNLNLKYFIFFL